MKPNESQHGPCTDGHAAVRDSIPDCVAPSVAEWVRARLDVGERKYGAKLLVGWSRAREALLEELADAIAYSVALGRPDLAVTFSDIITNLEADERRN